MIIRLDDEYNIIEAIRVGGDPNEEGCVEVFDVPLDILADIFSYKYYEGNFILRADADEQHIREAKQIKNKFISETCHMVIEAGVQIGDDHYSLDATDQMNLSKLATQAMMFPELPLFYHADGKLCRHYTPEEIIQLSTVGVAWITYHTTYNNFAQAYINSLSDFDTIKNFKYGSPIADDELNQQMQEIIATTQIHFEEEINDPFDYDKIIHPQRDFANEDAPAVDLI